jgi:hypothetical protein
MLRLAPIIHRLNAEIARTGSAELIALRKKLLDGPPLGEIGGTAWVSWHCFGHLPCPANQKKCTDPACGIGASCREMAAVGLRGNGRPLPRKQRPFCGAKTRKGLLCVARAVPGSRRCRMHGGASTGPRTPEGRARIADAQRRRWAEAGLK